jgi:hypothetical protein
MSGHGVLSVVAVLLVGLAWPVPGAAQPASPQGRAGTSAPTRVDLVAPLPPPRGPDFGLEPALPPEQQGAREQELYPERTRSIHAPAFVKGAATTVRTSRTTGARVGLSGWTAPRVPFDFREASGGVAFGLSIVWGVPMPEPPEAPAGSQR